MARKLCMQSAFLNTLSRKTDHKDLSYSQNNDALCDVQIATAFICSTKIMPLIMPAIYDAQQMNKMIKHEQKGPLLCKTPGCLTRQLTRFCIQSTHKNNALKCKKSLISQNLVFISMQTAHTV